LHDQERLTAGMTVRAGYYVNRDRPDLLAIGGDEATLPGNEGQRYFRLPVWAVLALAPLLGALFVVLRPLVGLPRWLPRAGRWLLRAIKGARRGLAFLLPSRWRRGRVASAEPGPAPADAPASPSGAADPTDAAARR
jgi:hypothetical protein